MAPSTALRRDAQGNVEKVKAAARRVFLQQGLDAPLETVARSAGVSIGTVYNRFGNREGLIDAVLPAIAAERFDALRTAALAAPTPWDRFAAFVEGMADLQASNRAMNDVIAKRYPAAAELLLVCEEVFAAGRTLIDEARDDGSLRADFTSDDLFALLWTLALAARDPEAPAAWRRLLTFTLDGLHA